MTTATPDAWAVPHSMLCDEPRGGCFRPSCSCICHTLKHYGMKPADVVMVRRSDWEAAAPSLNEGPRPPEVSDDVPI